MADALLLLSGLGGLCALYLVAYAIVWALGLRDVPR